MITIKDLYKQGVGPSSSHTMGPVKAVQCFLQRYPNADQCKVVLYGSLALTGKGHGTDRAIAKAFGNNQVDIIFDCNTPVPHPNTMDFYATEGDVPCQMRVFSIGGGAIVIEGEEGASHKPVYPHKSFAEIKQYCKDNGLRLWQYVLQCEGDDVVVYLEQMWQTMCNAINQGLAAEGVLEGGLGVVRRAKKLSQPLVNEDQRTYENRVVAAYAFAVGEQNASGGEIVTAPTCGACGVLPAVFRYESEVRSLGLDTVVHGLMTAGLVGNLAKHNASISGAECGCQAEVGVACSMAAAGLAEMLGMSIDEIEYAAEVALEHHLGLTCDPIGGLVQIPCIERNAVAAMRAINAVNLAGFLADSGKISLDMVLKTMYETGKDINAGYRETSLGGLAKHYTTK
ncbi:MAG: L-serine ammonia-lyase [Clostridia bacterium]|nr:L-serine ammonia-lyase [Clostridia bacterium]